ncbi:unnamed protein product [Ambrosiozyma monospora]|uniref:Unnamed protein product n=1 Tax=Ambrosiozyma monospora TaxID=43982 RepID=A0A9W7DKF5_AMBMO|nr:unnamed protein product [Ambrosiozyma monospora]
MRTIISQTQQKPSFPFPLIPTTFPITTTITQPTKIITINHRIPASTNIDPIHTIDTAIQVHAQQSRVSQQETSFMAIQKQHEFIDAKPENDSVVRKEQLGCELVHFYQQLVWNQWWWNLAWWNLAWWNLAWWIGGGVGLGVEKL